MSTGTLKRSNHVAAKIGRPEHNEVASTVSGSPPCPQWLMRTNRELPVDWNSLGPATRGLKRALDLCIAITMLLALAPLMFVVALLVKLASPGPAIFKQVRVGVDLRSKSNDRRQRASRSDVEDAQERRSGGDRRKMAAYGKPFVLYKFRTMRLDAEKDGAQFARKGDPRVTPLGRFMRKSRIDELPQLWNVFKGEMSLVGPRPERPEFVGELTREIPDYTKRLALKPGLTGVAQIVNGYDNNIESFRRKVALDLLYIRHCTLWNDLQILMRTVGVVLTGKGAL